MVAKNSMDLNRNYGAVKYLRQSARMGYVVDNGCTTERATAFAHAATGLAQRLGSQRL